VYGCRNGADIHHVAKNNGAPGWYTTPDGITRYWDGRKWVSDDRAAERPNKGRGNYTDPYLLTSTPIRILFAILTVLTCGLYGFVWLGVELVARSLKKRGY
jgi:secreted PhoX family phosphatase